MTRTVRLLVACLLLVLPGRVADVTAQTSPIYVQFDPFTVKGALYRPNEAPRDVAVLLIHRVNNYLGHLAARELSNRGFLVLTMNSRFDNNEASVIWEVIALDVKQGVEYLRRQPGIRKVVLFGHSGGAATLSFYQAVAEKGPSFCRAAAEADGLRRRARGAAEGRWSDPRRRLARERRWPAAQPQSRRRLRRRSQGDRSRARSVQPGQRIQSVWPSAVFAGFQGEVFRRPIGADEPSDRVGGRSGRPARQPAARLFPTTTSFLIVRADGARLVDEEEMAAPRHRGAAQAPQERRARGHRGRPPAAYRREDEP